MEVALSELAAKERYRLLIGLVVPRPIAFITTRGAGGIVNAAPFSFFNVMGEDPPVVVVSLETRADGSVKDTTRNIARTGEFVVNLVDEAIAAAMHQSSADYPPEVSEVAAVGLSLAPCRAVAVERIAEAPASLECRVMQALEVGRSRRIVIGEVLRLHVRDELIEPQSKRIRDDAYHPIGRLFGNSYVRTRDRFTFPPAIP